MSTGVGPVTAAPQNTVAPAITGDPTVGETLTCSTGTWTGTEPIMYSYQWLRDGTPISGATTNSYTLVEDDEGAMIDCGVTNGGVTAYAEAVGPVAAAWSPLDIAGLSAWYEPGDMSTLFQDSAGTTPVTAVEQPVGLMLDKSGNDRDLTQSISGDRPTLRARRNIVTNSVLAGGGAVPTGWSPVAGTGTSEPADWIDGDVVYRHAATAARPMFGQTVPLVAGQIYVASFHLRAIISGTPSISRLINVANPPAGTSLAFLVDNEEVDGSTTAVAGTRIGIRVTVGETSGNAVFRVGLGSVSNDTAEILFSSPQFERGSIARRYQRTDASGGYDDAGFPRYLQFGSGDNLTATLPDLGSDCTIARSIPGVGAEILSEQSISGEWEESIDSHALVIIPRQLSIEESAMLTEYLNAFLVDDLSAITRFDMPMQGLFYGNPHAGDHTGNSYLFAYRASRRFRAERSGSIVAVKHNNRTLDDQTIADRASGTNVWQTCIDYDLDSYLCGYTLSNSYSVGNGGLIEIEVQTDDGAGNPSGVVLATSEQYIPKSTASQYVELELDEPAALVAGQVYHLVYKQLNPPSDGVVAGVDPEAADSHPIDQGAVGLNGASWSSVPTVPLGGPWGADDATMRQSSPEGSWSTENDVLSWYEIKYSDGVWTGWSHTAYSATSDGRRTVGGSNQLRERFTVDYATRNVDGLWIRASRPGATSADLTVTIRNAAGDSLATATYAASAIPSSGTAEWVYADLSEPVELTLESEYRAELSSSETYYIPTNFPLDYSPYNSTARRRWNAELESSSNGGSSWSSADGGSYNREMSMLFCIVGGPRTMDE